MQTWPVQHLTADDLDAFHTEALSDEARLHLETCEACRLLAASDRQVLDALGRLEVPTPTDGFEDRVMARVAIGALDKVPVLSFPRFTRRRAVALAVIAASVAASVVWSAANRPALDAFLSGAGAEMVRTGWLAVRTVAANLTEQPWFETVRASLVGPGRIALAGAAGLVMYASGVLALRRLMTPSAEPVPHARA